MNIKNEVDAELENNPERAFLKIEIVWTYWEISSGRGSERQAWRQQGVPRTKRWPHLLTGQAMDPRYGHNIWNSLLKRTNNILSSFSLYH